MAKTDGDGWEQWKEHVLAELRRHQEWLANISHVQSEILVAVGQLKVKSGLWGAVAGFVTAMTALGIGLAIWFIRG